MLCFFTKVSDYVWCMSLFKKRGRDISIIIKRKTGLLGSRSRISVKVNGEKLTKIAYNQEIKNKVIRLSLYFL